MSDGNKFWRVALGPHPDRRNYVTTREYGDIPGILKACDIHLVVPEETMRAATAERAEGFCQRLNWWRNGRDDRGFEYGHREFQNDPFHSKDTVLSAVGNPSVPYKKDWWK